MPTAHSLNITNYLNSEWSCALSPVSSTEGEIETSNLSTTQDLSETQLANKNNLIDTDSSVVQQEAMKRLKILEEQMVGGENVNNKEIKEKRKKKIKVVEERKRRLAEAVANMDDDFIMIGIYENIHDELQEVTKKLGKAQKKVAHLESEFSDIQSEFEMERTDYLQTIRKQDRQVQLYQAILDQIQPCLRRDSNYYNLDKIKSEAQWEEESQKWILPKVSLEKTLMPAVDIANNTVAGKNPEQYSTTNYTSSNLSKAEDDRLREKLWKNDNSSNYFYQMRRSSQLISEQTNRMSISQIKESFSSGNSINMQHQHGGPCPNSENQQEIILKTSTTAPDPTNEQTLRKPVRLEALNVPFTHGRKPKKKRNQSNMFE
ncbi:kinesin-like protein KIF17 [Argonauta hians]